MTLTYFLGDIACGLRLVECLAPSDIESLAYIPSPVAIHQDSMKVEAPDVPHYLSVGQLAGPELSVAKVNTGLKCSGYTCINTSAESVKY